MRMRPANDLLQVLQPHVGVDLSAGDLRVAEDGLDMAKVRMVQQQMRGHGMAAMSPTT